jgi:TetR/AcrR family tetracycline transcriptional repressor
VGSARKAPEGSAGSAVTASAKAPAITREALAAASLAVLRRDGLDALSMRKVAAELGVRAASLYWHVQDKEELLDLVADSLLWDARKLTAKGAWDANLREMAVLYRRHLQANRDSARVMAGRVPGPNLLYVIDTMLGWLRTAGFSAADAALATRTMATYVQGFVLQEQLPESGLGAGPAGTAAAASEAFRAAPTDQYPNVAVMAEAIVGDGMDDVFLFGIERIIEGLRPLAGPGQERPERQEGWGCVPDGRDDADG